MVINKSLQESIKDLEYKLVKFNAILKVFPDTKIQHTSGKDFFISKTVNQQYNKLAFKKTSDSLKVVPYYELNFEFEGNNKIAIVNSSPKYSRLAYIPWRRYNEDKLIRFSRLSINLKSNNFKDDMMNECRIHIMNFIKDKSDHKLDDKHLEPRLKKLLLFT